MVLSEPEMLLFTLTPSSQAWVGGLSAGAMTLYNVILHRRCGPRTCARARNAGVASAPSYAVSG